MDLGDWSMGGDSVNLEEAVTRWQVAGEGAHAVAGGPKDFRNRCAGKDFSPIVANDRRKVQNRTQSNRLPSGTYGTDRGVGFDGDVAQA